MVIVFESKALADEICADIGCTPFGLVAMHYELESPASKNIVPRPEEQAGRAANEHPFSEEDAAWLEAYCAGWIDAGKVQILDKMPEDWVSKPE